MINRSIIKLCAYDHGFNLQGLPGSDVRRYLNEIIGYDPKLFVNFNRIDVSLFESGSIQSNFILGGQLVLKYLSEKFNLIVLTSTSDLSVSVDCENVPEGLGEPCFDKFHAVLCKELLLITNAIGFEIGSGFSGSRMRGSEHNDLIYMKNNKLVPITNFSGGVLGGITCGSRVHFKVIFSEIKDNTHSLIKTITAIVILDLILLQSVRKLKQINNSL
jgi:Chorismate synthase